MLAARVLTLRSQHVATGRLLVGVAGVPGSGKTSVAARACTLLGDNTAVVGMDGYHYPRAVLDTFKDGEFAHARRGAPFTFDAVGFVSLLRRLRSGDAVRVPTFDHAAKDPAPGEMLDTGVDTIIVEGNYLLLNDGAWKEVKGILDEVSFLDVDVEQAMCRVEDRHVREMGVDRGEARQRVDGNDRLNAMQIIKSRERADFCIDKFGVVTEQ